MIFVLAGYSHIWGATSRDPRPAPLCFRETYRAAGLLSYHKTDTQIARVAYMRIIQALHAIRSQSSSGRFQLTPTGEQAVSLLENSISPQLLQNLRRSPNPDLEVHQYIAGLSAAEIEKSTALISVGFDSLSWLENYSKFYIHQDASVSESTTPGREISANTVSKDVATILAQIDDSATLEDRISGFMTAGRIEDELVTTKLVSLLDSPVQGGKSGCIMLMPSRYEALMVLRKLFPESNPAKTRFPTQADIDLFKSWWLSRKEEIARSESLNASVQQSASISE